MPKPVRLPLYSFMAASLLLLGYILQPVSARLSWPWIVLGLGVSIVLLALAWLQFRFWITPLWAMARQGERLRWLAASAALGLLCFALLTPTHIQVLEKFPALAPREQLEVRPLLAGAGQSVSIQRIKAAQRRLPSSSIHLEGLWQADGYLLRTDDPRARLTLGARVPRGVTLVFLRSPTAGSVEVAWAGMRQTIDLRSAAQEEAVYTFDFDRSHPPLVTTLIRWLTLPAWLGVALAAYGALLLPFGGGRTL